MQEREQVDQAKEAIKREEFYFDSSDGETGIRVLAWIPATAPRAIVQIAHGMVEHIERYDDFARMLAASGYVVFGNDHIGHGKSVVHVSELGELPVGGNDIMISDVDALRRIAQDRFPGIPYVLFGHSMGGAVSSRAAMRAVMVRAWRGLSCADRATSRVPLRLLASAFPDLSRERVDGIIAASFFITLPLGLMRSAFRMLPLRWLGLTRRKNA